MKKLRCNSCHAIQWKKIAENKYQCQNCGEIVRIIKISKNGDKS